jgi:hypothetical protein
VLAVWPVGAVLAEADHRSGAAARPALALLPTVALDAVGSVPVALTPEEEKTERKLFEEIHIREEIISSF